jgi:hypothetical protein
VDYLIITSSALSNAFQQIADYRASAAGGGYTTRVLTTNDIGGAYSGGTSRRRSARASAIPWRRWGRRWWCWAATTRSCWTATAPFRPEGTSEPKCRRTCTIRAGRELEQRRGRDLRRDDDGVDMAWDVVVGRLPVRTAAQVTNYLNKVMTYESGSPVTNKIILGGPYAWDTYTGTGRPSDDVTIDGHAGFRSTSPGAHLRERFRSLAAAALPRRHPRPIGRPTVSIMCDTLTSWDSTSCGDHLQSAANTVAAFNKNYTHLMFSGHGAPQEWGLESGSSP